MILSLKSQAMVNYFRYDNKTWNVMVIIVNSGKMIISYVYQNMIYMFCVKKCSAEFIAQCIDHLVSKDTIIAYI